MRKFIYIIAAILCYMTLSSRSCSEGSQKSDVRPEEQLLNEKTEIKSEFESGAIHEKSLLAFEAKAKQKLTDLSDYLNILSDSSTDNSFREQSKLMISNLFISDTVCISSRLSGNYDNSKLRINEFLKSEAISGPKNIALDSIRITDPLHIISEYRYIGRLIFNRRIKLSSLSDSGWSSPVTMQAEFFVSKIPKSFGNETLRIWNLSLGNIE